MTDASHQAMFAGFLPTPAEPGPHPRLFAARFAGSETTASGTFVYDTPDLVSGLAAVGYTEADVPDGRYVWMLPSASVTAQVPALFWTPV